MFTSPTNSQNVAPSDKPKDGVEIAVMPKYVPCAKRGFKILEMIGEEFGENIAAMGAGERDSGNDNKVVSQFILLWNSKTKTYSVTEMFPDGGLCVLLTGRDLTFMGKFTPDVEGKEVTPDPKGLHGTSISYDSNMPVNRPVH